MTPRLLIALLALATLVRAENPALPIARVNRLKAPDGVAKIELDSSLYFKNSGDKADFISGLGLASGSGARLSEGSATFGLVSTAWTSNRGLNITGDLDVTGSITGNGGGLTGYASEFAAGTAAVLWDRGNQISLVDGAWLADVGLTSNGPLVANNGLTVDGGMNTNGTLDGSFSLGSTALATIRGQLGFADPSAQFWRAIGPLVAVHATAGTHGIYALSTGTGGIPLITESDTGAPALKVFQHTHTDHPAIWVYRQAQTNYDSPLVVLNSNELATDLSTRRALLTIGYTLPDSGKHWADIISGTGDLHSDGNVTATGNVSATHFGSQDSSGFTSVSLASGVTFDFGGMNTCRDLAGHFSFSSTATGDTRLLTVAFLTSYGSAPAIVLTPCSAAAAADIAKVYVEQVEGGGFYLHQTSTLSTGIHSYGYTVLGL